jgi:hypothetical protein
MGAGANGWFPAPLCPGLRPHADVSGAGAAGRPRFPYHARARNSSALNQADADKGSPGGGNNLSGKGGNARLIKTIASLKGQAFEESRSFPVAGPTRGLLIFKVCV